MNNLIRFITVMFLLTITFGLSTNHAPAHGDDYFDGKPSPHGGQVRMSGPYHFELTMSDISIVIYVTDHADQPIATTGATAKLQVSASGKKTLIEVPAAGENTFKAEWPGAVSPDLTARLTVKFPNEKAQKIKFTPFAKRKE